VDVLREGYVYDVLGNVAQRTQIWGSASAIENFEYDGLNRLKSAAILGTPQQNFGYDDIGNMLSKTGVGTGAYQYPASGVGSTLPHAVSSIPGVGTFYYDGNGNMTSGAGRTITWNSFDMPMVMTQGGDSSTFYYGPDHQRVTQVRSDGVTIRYAGAMEVEVKAGATTAKTYLPLGVGVEIDNANGTQLYYTHRDRLGSVVAISDQGGNIVEQLAYDSWGKRRALTAPDTPASLDGVVDNKGFTGHEMLDKLDLVHMNGRVYDPLVARFMSADPYIQDPHHSQSYNRYSYVWNNPTNLTDPTGFVAQMESSIAIQACAQSVGCQTDGRTITGTFGYNQSGEWVRTSGADNSGGAGGSSRLAAAPMATNTANANAATKSDQLNSSIQFGPNGGMCDAGCGEWAPSVGEDVAWGSQKGAYVHQRVGYLVFGDKINSDALSSVSAGHEWADASNHQTAQYTYMHAMRNETQTPEEAKAAANTFIRSAASMALAAKEKGDMKTAYFWYGVALHTMQDSTSPSHRGFQLWTGHESGMQVGKHVIKEVFVPSANSDVFRITTQAWQAFQAGKIEGFRIP
jgi:RHS repeat-associated protein